MHIYNTDWPSTMENVQDIITESLEEHKKCKVTPMLKTNRRPDSNRPEVSMVRRPDATHTVVDTRNGFLGALQLLATGLLQQIGLLEYLFRFEVPHTNRLLTSVDIVNLDDRVLVRSW